MNKWPAGGVCERSRRRRQPSKWDTPTGRDAKLLYAIESCPSVCLPAYYTGTRRREKSDRNSRLSGRPYTQAHPKNNGRTCARRAILVFYPRDSADSVTFLFTIARQKNQQLPAHAAAEPSNVLCVTPDCAETPGGPARVIAKCHGYDIWKNKSAEMLDRLMRFIGEAWLSFPWDKNKKRGGGVWNGRRPEPSWSTCESPSCWVFYFDSYSLFSRYYTNNWHGSGNTQLACWLVDTCLYPRYISKNYLKRNVSQTRHGTQEQATDGPARSRWL